MRSRTSTCDKLAHGPADRSPSVQSRVGHEGGLGYEGGHLFGNATGGGGEYVNMASMLRELNRGAGESFGNMERGWRKILGETPLGETPPTIEVNIRPRYEGASTVPSKVQVSFRVDNGRWQSGDLINAK
jgi:DNA/RNA non-specific endonuclease